MGSSSIKGEVVIFIPLLSVSGEVPVLDLMPGVSLRKLTLPASWPTTAAQGYPPANVYLTIQRRRIARSRFYERRKLTEQEILNAFYAYCFFRSNLDINIDNYKSISYFVIAEDLSHLDNAQLLQCDDFLDTESFAYFRGGATTSETDKFISQLYEDSYEFPKYITYAGGLAGASVMPNREVPCPIYIARKAIESGFYEDQYSDELQTILIFTALEALFTRNDGGEVTYKLAHNISYFLYPRHSQYDERLQFMKKFKRLYDFRSKLAHGGKTAFYRGAEYEESMALLRSVMRKVIEKYTFAEEFYDTKSHEAFIDRLQAGRLLFARRRGIASNKP